MKVVQATLRSDNSYMTTWLDKRDDVKEGTVITLKEVPGKKWLVTKLFDKELESADLDFHRKWDNNNYDKHTGLGLK